MKLKVNDRVKLKPSSAAALNTPRAQHDWRTRRGTVLHISRLGLVRVQWDGTHTWWDPMPMSIFEIIEDVHPDAVAG